MKPRASQNSLGAVWRKWDLHVHAPGTKKNNGYGQPSSEVWDEYCKKLECSDVHAFGITDYFSADGYFQTIAEFKKRYRDSQKIFFANIELCTNDVVNKANEHVNVHVVFDPAEPQEKIREFLRNLKTNATTGKGSREVRASELKDTSDYEAVTTTRKDIETAISETFGPKAERTDHSLLFSAVNNDGIRPERGVKRKELLSDELDKLSNGFFGNSKNTSYFLRPDRLDSGEGTDPKPVLNGSDAHSFDDLSQWLGKMVLRNGDIHKECTWIKADLTFEGLRQILFEPEGRVFIGEEPEVEIRVKENPRRYLKTLQIESVPEYRGRLGSWFQHESIELNKELVAIIGNKGSGKSALTDILGLLGNSHNQRHKVDGREEELFSFLNREKFLKGGCAANFAAQIHWHSGPSKTEQLNASVDENLPEQVEYLPQKYLEKICANIDDNEFRSKLNEVIFEYVQEGDRYGTRSLQDLVDYLGRQSAAEIELAKKDLHARNEVVVALEKKRAPSYSKELESRLTLKEAEVNAHVPTRPPTMAKPPDVDPAAAQITADIQALDAKIASLTVDIASAQQEQAELSRKAEELRQARQAIERQAGVIKGLASDYQSLFAQVGLRFDEIVSVRLQFGGLDRVVEGMEQRLGQIKAILSTSDEITARRLDAAAAATARSASSICERERLQTERLALIDRLDQPNRSYQAYLRKEREWQARHIALVGSTEQSAEGTVNWIRQELTRIDNDYPRELLDCRQTRERASRTLLEKKKGLLTFYNTVKAAIDREIASFGSDLQDYAITIEAGLRLEPKFHEEFFSFISHTARGSFHGVEEGKTQLKEVIARVNDWQDEDAVLGALASIVEMLDVDQRFSSAEDRVRDIDNQLRQHKDAVEFYDYLFGLSYLTTKYDLKVDGKDLSELSPGERGGLLLIFYLMLDKRDIPLVIDQPEDNLDNKSVYEILVTFLKRAKKRRQIIIATHNPNLAVVADAEQIIRVSIDKKNQNDFDLQSGAIENPIINLAVVDILEGTFPAFDNRRLKYRKH